MTIHPIIKPHHLERTAYEEMGARQIGNHAGLKTLHSLPRILPASTRLATKQRVKHFHHPTLDQEALNRRNQFGSATGAGCLDGMLSVGNSGCRAPCWF